ncbi:hypothetical protein CY0110_17677 [Crocosphaera chwakensis CCY0110]|uniref:Uncharacterized protein n=1 Tax=Crocosphaera chwakensis CCY0110 TaxID=391612 RepID=A3IIL7_9CHRO|nr:hypothetical protein CY0110_17677 [Crocosphaera chwakensis CCY0110]
MVPSNVRRISFLRSFLESLNQQN